MTLRFIGLVFVGLVLVVGAVERETSAQPVPCGEGTVIAEFDDAQALAADPRGRLYVADAGRDVVVVMDAQGERLEVIGGPGTRAGEFDTPSDVDPTNGQVVLVADTYNGRVQRFSEEGQYLESLPIGGGQWEDGDERGFADGREGATVQGRGHPIAVESGENGALYILDERDAALLRWSPLRGMDKIAGGLGGTNVRLRDPVSVALGGRGRVYVADASEEGVLVFDRFGTFVRRLSTPPLPRLKGMTMQNGRLWIVQADGLHVWNESTEQLVERPLDIQAPLEGVLVQPNGLYVLTPTTLIRRTR